MFPYTSSTSPVQIKNQKTHFSHKLVPFNRVYGVLIKLVPFKKVHGVLNPSTSALCHVEWFRVRVRVRVQI
jgi:hypothetical protein